VFRSISIQNIPKQILAKLGCNDCWIFKGIIKYIFYFLIVKTYLSFDTYYEKSLCNINIFHNYVYLKKIKNSLKHNKNYNSNKLMDIREK